MSLSFHEAIIQNNMYAIITMLQMDPQLINRRDPKFGYSPLALAVIWNNMSLAIFLLDHGADVNLRNAGVLDTPLWCACAYGYIHLVDLLMSRGGDPTKPDIHGTTPLIIGSENGHVDVVRYLLKHSKGVRAAIDSGGDGRCRTPLIFGCLRLHVELVKVLIDNGANPTLCDRDKRTAMDYLIGFPASYNRDACIWIVTVSIWKVCNDDIDGDMWR